MVLKDNKIISQLIKENNFYYENLDSLFLDIYENVAKVLKDAATFDIDSDDNYELSNQITDAIYSILEEQLDPIEYKSYN